jgi:SAM-dependent methyltransferase
MGIGASDLHIFDAVFRDPGLAALPRKRIACLGYPDLIVSDATYTKFFHDRDWRGTLAPRENREKLLAIHGGSPALVSVVPTASSFFALYGDTQVDVIDFAQYEGSELIHDMSTPIPDDFAGRYDLVIDAGTTEHIFDFSTALSNCVRMLKVGGLVYHNVPMNMLNHGFYNFSPTLFFDFYEDNGFETLGCVGVPTGMNDNPQFADIPPVDRFRLEGETCLIYAARKVRALDRIVKPIQRKYRDIDKWR